MKIDELLKRLENIKINENERREIAEYIVQTFGNKRMQYLFYVMTKDRTIYDYGEYRDLLKSNKISPNDAYVYLENNHLSRYHPSSYFYPFFRSRNAPDRWNIFNIRLFIETRLRKRYLLCSTCYWT